MATISSLGNGGDLNDSDKIPVARASGTNAYILGNNILKSNTFFQTTLTSTTSAFNTKSHTTNGHQELYGGLILQWGRYLGANIDDSHAVITFPRPFPNQVLNVVAVPEANANAAPTAVYSCAIQYISNTQFRLYGSSVVQNPTGYSWFAIGI